MMDFLHFADLVTLFEVDNFILVMDIIIVILYNWLTIGHLYDFRAEEDLRQSNLPSYFWVEETGARN